MDLINMLYHVNNIITMDLINMFDSANNVNMVTMDRINILDLPTELLIKIFNKLDLQSQINLKKSCHLLCQLDITNFWDLGHNFLFITPQILQRYPRIKYLKLRNNKYVSNINYLVYIKKLDIVGSAVREDGIKSLTHIDKLWIGNNIDTNNIASKPTFIKVIDNICSVGYAGPIGANGPVGVNGPRGV